MPSGEEPVDSRWVRLVDDPTKGDRASIETAFLIFRAATEGPRLISSVVKRMSRKRKKKHANIIYNLVEMLEVGLCGQS